MPEPQTHWAGIFWMAPNDQRIIITEKANKKTIGFAVEGKLIYYQDGNGQAVLLQEHMQTNVRIYVHLSKETEEQMQWAIKDLNAGGFYPTAFSQLNAFLDDEGTQYNPDCCKNAVKEFRENQTLLRVENNGNFEYPWQFPRPKQKTAQKGDLQNIQARFQHLLRAASPSVQPTQTAAQQQQPQTQTQPQTPATEQASTGFYTMPQTQQTETPQSPTPGTIPPGATI